MNVDKALKNILKFNNKDMDQHGKRIAAKHAGQFTSGIDADGKPFEPYTVQYANKKKAGKAAKNQVSTITSPVNLTLTGQLLKEFEHISSTTEFSEIGFDYGVEDPVLGQRLHDFAKGRYGKKINRTRKRVVAANQKVGPRIEIALVDMFVSQIVNNLNRLAKRAKTVINV